MAKSPASGVESVNDFRRLILRPNGSLSWGQAKVFLAAMCLVSFGIAGGFAALGYWMVLPFAGLEMLALAAGLYISLRTSGYREVLSFEGDRLKVEAGKRHPERSWVFPSHWVRLSLRPPAGLNGRSRLLLGCSGKECEIGAFLTDTERDSLAQQLQALLAEQRKLLLVRSRQR